MVTEYLKKAGLIEPLSKLGFNVVAYGCTTCIGNSGPLPGEVAKAVTGSDLVAAAVSPATATSKAASTRWSRPTTWPPRRWWSPMPLPVRWTLTLTTNRSAPARMAAGLLKDLWPTQQEISEAIDASVKSGMFNDKYADVFEGSDMWKEIKVTGGRPV